MTDVKPYTDEDEIEAVRLMAAEGEDMEPVLRLLATLDERTRERDEALEDAVAVIDDRELVRAEAASLREEVARLQDLVDGYKAASGLVDSSGDPDGVEPRHVEREISLLRADSEARAAAERRAEEAEGRLSRYRFVLTGALDAMEPAEASLEILTGNGEPEPGDDDGIARAELSEAIREVRSLLAEERATHPPQQQTPAPDAKRWLGGPEHVEVWDAVNEYAEACGGSSNRNVGSPRRMNAVSRVERAIEAFCDASDGPGFALRSRVRELEGHLRAVLALVADHLSDDLDAYDERTAAARATHPPQQQTPTEVEGRLYEAEAWVRTLDDVESVAVRALEHYAVTYRDDPVAGEALSTMQGLREEHGRPQQTPAPADEEAGWRKVDDDTAFATPFGTVRKCRWCGCLVAGGPTACARCAALPSQEQPAAPPWLAEAREHDVTGVLASDETPTSTPEAEPGYDLPPDAPENPEGEPADDDADPSRWEPGDVVALPLPGSVSWTLLERVERTSWPGWRMEAHGGQSWLPDDLARDQGWRRIRRASTDERRG